MVRAINLVAWHRITFRPGVRYNEPGSTGAYALSTLVLSELAQRAIPVHALTNRVFVATANRIGAEGNLVFTGLSTIADPKGTVMAQASPTEEEVCVTDIDVERARDKAITTRKDVLRDRRHVEYSFLLGQETGQASSPS